MNQNPHSILHLSMRSEGCICFKTMASRLVHMTTAFLDTKVANILVACCHLLNPAGLA